MISVIQLNKKYGRPNPRGTGYLVRLNLPYPMRLSWELNTVVNSLQCHRLIKDRLEAALKQVLSDYGIDRIKQLELDIFGGCFVYRLMRGGTELSRHSWGVAIDFNPNKNTLKMNRNNSQFAKPEYKQFIDAFYKNGFVNMGVEKGFDFMHFEIKE